MPQNEKLKQLCTISLIDGWVFVTVSLPRGTLADKHRTNNSIEGWQRRLNVAVGITTPNVYCLVKKLEETVHFSISIRQVQAGV